MKLLNAYCRSLPGNSGYLVNLCLNIATTQESSSAGVANGPIHLHHYVLRLIDPSTGIQYGKTLTINAESIALANARAHTLNMSFSFVTNSNTPIRLMPSISHATGGTYESGAGQLTDAFTFYQGTFYLTLNSTTAIKQKFEFDTGNGYINNPLNIRPSFSLVITRMAQ